CHQKSVAPDQKLLKLCSERWRGARSSSHPGSFRCPSACDGTQRTSFTKPDPIQMTYCKICNQEMGDSSIVTCTGNLLISYPDRKWRTPIPYHGRDGERCGDCNVGRGGRHHPGCDREVCPRCGGQLISCLCGIGIS